MTRSPRLRVAWTYLKQYAAAIVAVALIFEGIGQTLKLLRYPIANGIVKVINAVIIRGFRDRIPLPEYWGLPWQVNARILSYSAMVVVTGIFFGLWANIRSQRKPTQKQSPRRSEG